MRRIGWIAGMVLGLWGCSQDDCPTGEACEKDCNPGESALCVAEGICSCVPGGQLDGGAGAGGAGGGAGGGGEACRPPVPGELIIDEVMIDGIAPDDENEFIELVNAAGEAVSVRGIKITGSKPDDQKERVIFTGGCLPAGTAVAMFKAVDRWVWSEAPSPLPTFETKGFSFTNSADFQFEVRDANGVLLNTFAGSGDLDADGVSVTANPPLSGMPANHMDVAGTPSSPGRCFNGGTYANDCQDGGGMGGGEGGMGGGMGGAGGMAQPPRALVINEVDYDQAGSDTAEFVEIYNADAQPADLSNYTLVFTNGPAGELARSLPLVGELPPGGYFVAGSASVLAALPGAAVGMDLGSSIQNGGNDGVFLRHADGTTVDGVSWEGASAGATEGNPTAIVDAGDGSLGRCPDGADTDDNATDFAANSIPSPGVANGCPMGMGGMGGGMGGMGGVGGGMGGMGGVGGGVGGMGGVGGGMGGMGGGVPNDPVALVINEVEADDPGTDDAEYVEILNRGDTEAVLAEYTLEFMNGDAPMPASTLSLGTADVAVLAPGARLVVGDASVLPMVPAGVARAALTFTIQNGPDGLRLRHVSGAFTDRMSFGAGVFANVTETAPAPVDPQGAVDQPVTLSRCPDGQDSDDNSADFQVVNGTLGAPNLCP